MFDGSSRLPLFAEHFAVCLLAMFSLAFVPTAFHTARPPPPTPPPTCTRSNCVPRLPDECRYSATCSQAVGCLSQSVLLGDCESFDSCPDCTLGLTPTQTQAAIDYAECSAACNTAIRTGTCSFDCFAAAKTCMDDDDCQGAYICYIRAYLRSVRKSRCADG